jgi:Tol biopolymer transport system component/DNA-binding winged helix-turn-helix (wHTH) protein
LIHSVRLTGLDFSFLILNVTDLKDIRAGRHFRSGEAGEITIRQPQRKNGFKVPLQGQPFQVFAILLQHSGKLVTREELRQRVWPEDTFVDFDHGLNTAITKIRTALGDSAENPRFVETLPRRGYRFIGPADKPISPAPSPSALKGHLENLTARWRWIGVGVAALALLSTVAIWRLSPKSAESLLPALEVVPLLDMEGKLFWPAFSPDGNQVAFIYEGGPKTAGIYTTLIDGEQPLRLTDNPDDVFPAWSPDSRQIAFVRVSKEGLNIYVVPALGGTEHKLHTAASLVVNWSPDGKVLAFSEGSADSSHAWIALLSLADLTTRPLTSPSVDNTDSQPAFSPDGSTVGFVRTAEPGGRSDLLVVSAKGGEPRQITFDNGDINGLAWTKDGHDIVFSSSRRRFAEFVAHFRFRRNTNTCSRGRNTRLLSLNLS